MPGTSDRLEAIFGRTTRAGVAGAERRVSTGMEVVERWWRQRARAIVTFLYGIWPYLALYVILYLVTATIFWLVERSTYTWSESLYFSIDTFAGITFGDVVPTNSAARALAGFMVLLTVFLLALVITGFGRRAEAVARQDDLGMLGTDLKDHYVILGSDAVAQASARYLLANGFKVGLLAERPEDVDHLRAMGPREQLFLTYGPAADETTLDRLNVATCKAVIVSMDDDAQSVIVALLVRTRAPQARVVVSALRPELRSTIRTAGVTFVASPLEMAGRVCATAAFAPEVASTLDELTTVAVGSDLTEHVLAASSPLVGRPFREAAKLAAEHADSILIGYARAAPGGPLRPVIAPKGDDVLQSGDAVLVVVRADQREALRRWLSVPAGR